MLIYGLKNNLIFFSKIFIIYLKIAIIYKNIFIK
uniref:Uncharacterized protein n=1 Tax=viral metagenome TaxID=1070528 RepID=A0A6C0H986_9ZZZZ